MLSSNHNLTVPPATLSVCLLLPHALFAQLMRRLKREKSGLRLYLSHIIQSAQSQAVTLPSVSRVTTLYQRSNLNLVRLNARLPSSLWLQLRAIARSRGVSVCYLVSFLLQQDRENEESVETSIKQLQFREILDLAKKTLYRELRIYPWYKLRL